MPFCMNDININKIYQLCYIISGFYVRSQRYKPLYMQIRAGGGPPPILRGKKIPISNIANDIINMSNMNFIKCL